jgi:hypothetical protein
LLVFRIKRSVLHFEAVLDAQQNKVSNSLIKNKPYLANY